jgi:hypothetical protein
VFGPEGEIKDARELVRLARERTVGVRAARGHGDGKFGGTGASYLYALERPARMRVDVLNPFGQPQLSMATDGERFALYDLGAKTFYRGAATAENMARLLRVPVAPATLVRALLGDPPVLDGEPEIIGVDAGGYRVVVRGAGGPDDFQLLLIETRWLRIVHSEQRGFVVQYQRFPDRAGPALPGRVVIIDKSSAQIELEPGPADIDPEIPAEVFVLEPPEGAAVVDLG